MAIPHSSPVTSRVIAASVSVLLHALALALVLHPGTEPNDPGTHGAGAALAGASLVAGVWLDLSSRQVARPAPASRTAAAAAGSSPVVAIPLALDLGAATLVTDENGAAVETQDVAIPWYVRYVGQLTASVQSAWTPPASTASSSFHCRVVLHRPKDGDAHQVSLQDCDPDPAVQASVLRAVRDAMPLASSPGLEAPADVMLELSAFAAGADGRRTSVQPTTAAL